MSEAKVAAVVVFALYEVIAVLFFVLASRMAREALPPNRFVGIRTAITMSSPRAWYVGHRATAPHMRWVAGILAVAGPAVLAVGLLDGPEELLAGMVIGASVLVVGTVLASSVVARRAVLADQADSGSSVKRL